MGSFGIQGNEIVPQPPSPHIVINIRSDSAMLGGWKGVVALHEKTRIFGAML